MADYTTTDLGFASFLFAKGVEYRGIRAKDNDWRVEFVFAEPDPTLPAGWQSGTMEVGGQAMWTASRKLAREVKKRERENG